MTATWISCDSMRRLNLRQREIVAELITTQLNSAKIAIKVGCTERRIKLIRAARKQERDAARDRDTRARHHAVCTRMAMADTGEWPKVDGGDFLEALVAAAHPAGLHEPKVENTRMFAKILTCRRPVARVRFGAAMS